MEKEDKQLEQMVKQFKLAIFWAFIGMLALFLLFGCGSSRKVEKQRIKEETEKKEKIVVENDITATDNITITSKSFVIDSTKEEIEEIEIMPIDLLKPAYYENKELKNTKLVKRKIKRNKALSETNNTNTQHDSKTQDKSKKTGEKEEKRTKDEKTKQSERKFDYLAFIFNWWWVLLILYCIYWTIKNFKKVKEKIPIV